MQTFSGTKDTTSVSNSFSNKYQNEYNAEFEKMTLQSARVLTIMAVVLAPASSVLDYFLYPEHLSHFLVIRSLMSLSALSFFGLTYIRRAHRFASHITMGAMIMMGAGIAYMVHTIGYHDPYYAGLNLIYLALMVTPWGMGITLLTCLIIYSFYLLPVLLFGHYTQNIPLFVNNNVFQIETIIIATVVNHFQCKRRKIEILNRLTIVKQAEELEEIDRHKREFISNITHELKTPLAIVMGNADLIQDKTDSPDILSKINVIRTAAFQLANHVDRIITVSNIDDPDIKPDLGNYDYIGVVQNVFCTFESRAKLDNIDYRIQTVPGPIVVSLDIIKIEEVLNNLLQNAFKFTPPKGSIVVTVSTDGEKVFTEIADTGVGIREEETKKIFDRLHQADDVLSKRHGGMGIGLYICKKNVEIHGGEISVHSKPGKGSSFKYSLPLYVDQTAQVKNPSKIPSPPKEHSNPMIERRINGDRRRKDDSSTFEYRRSMDMEELARMTFADNVYNYENQNPNHPTILIMEDNPGMMKVIVEALREDYNLIPVGDAIKGLEKLEELNDRISLILSDVMMPHMSGFDFLKQISDDERFKHIPVIFVTALMSQEDQLKGFSLGATDYLIKPYNIKILKEKVDHWIARRNYELLLKEASSVLENRVAQISKTKDILLHEIGNPLQMISGAGYFIEKLRTSRISEATDRERQLWESTRALDHGVRAIRSVLETSRHMNLSEGTIRKKEKAVDIIDESLKQVNHLIADIPTNVEVSKIKDSYINCDRRMLVQVFVNLIRNAVEAIREHHSEASKGLLKICADTIGTKELMIRLSDNGVGISQEIMSQLFRFKFTNKKNGTGVGLHMSKMIIKLHDGSVSVQSDKGKGTTFTIILPLAANGICSDPQDDIMLTA